MSTCLEQFLKSVRCVSVRLRDGYNNKMVQANCAHDDGQERVHHAEQVHMVY